jgi:ribosomal protein S18 acetylase RimI-like enzyme
MTEPEILVREAAPDEYEKVAELTIQAYEEFAPDLMEDEWERYRLDLANVEGRSKEAKIIVAEQDGQLVGSVAYFPPGTRDPQVFPPDWSWIRVLAVHPSHRGKGIGRLLTKECIERARKDGATSIGLYTTQVMEVAKTMYERMGFERQEEYEWRPGLKAWSYAMTLNRS